MKKLSIRYGMTGKRREAIIDYSPLHGRVLSGNWIDDGSELDEEDCLMFGEAFEYELREEAIDYRAEEAYDRWKDGE